NLFVRTDTIVCNGSPLNVELGGYIPRHYHWSFTSDTSSSPPINGAGIYSVTVNDVNGCFAKDTITVNATHGAVPNVDFAIGNLCLGNPTFFSNLSTTDSPDVIKSCQWYLGTISSNNCN